MNLVGRIIHLEEICFCSFSVDEELYQFLYNYECGYIDRMEDFFTIEIDKSKAEVVYKYLKKQDI